MVAADHARFRALRQPRRQRRDLSGLFAEPAGDGTGQRIEQQRLAVLAYARRNVIVVQRGGELRQCLGCFRCHLDLPAVTNFTQEGPESGLDRLDSTLFVLMFLSRIEDRRRRRRRSASKTRVTALMAPSLTRTSTRTTSIQAIKAASPISQIDPNTWGFPFPASCSKSGPSRRVAPGREESTYAAEPPTARRTAPGFAGTRRGEIRRRLVFREIRRDPCAGHRHAGRPPAALAQGPGPRLDHCRIRHAAARYARTHAARGLRRQAERPHCRDPAA